MNSSLLKSVSGNWDLTEITQKAHLNKHKDIIPVGSADVAAVLSKNPDNVVARNWKFYSTVTETKKWMKTSTNVRIFMSCESK